MTRVQTCMICGCRPCESPAACRQTARMEAEDATCQDYEPDEDEPPDYDPDFDLPEPDPDDDRLDDEPDWDYYDDPEGYM